MLNKSFFVGVVLVLTCLTTPVFPDQQEGLTLDQAIAIALTRNTDVLSVKAEVEASRGRSLQFSARPDPQVTAAVEAIPIPGLKKSGEMEINLNFEQVFEFPGKRSLRDQFGHLGVRIAESELERVKMIIAAKVKRAYWKAAYAMKATQTLEKSTTRLDLLLEDLQAKYRSASAAYADILRARAEKARLRNQVLEGENERRSACLELNALMSRQADAPIVLLTEMLFSPLSSDLSAIQESARFGRPSQKIAVLRKELAAASLKLAKLGGSPDFTAAVSLPSKRPEAWGISFGLTLPFLQPRRTRGLNLEAGADAEIAALSAEMQDRHIVSALANAYSSVKTAEAQVMVFERSLLRELEDELRIQVEYFRYGKIDFHDLLDLHRTYVLAELDHIRAVLLYNLALADLEVAGEEMSQSSSSE